LKNTQKKLRDTIAKLNATELELYKVKKDAARNQHELTKTNEKLETAKQECSNKTSGLSSAVTRITATETQLKSTIRTLEMTRDTMETHRMHLLGMMAGMNARVGEILKDVHNVSAEIKITNQAASRTKSDLSTTSTKLSQTTSGLADVQSKLTSTMNQLRKTVSELYTEQKNIQSNSQQIDVIERKLNKTSSDLQVTNANHQQHAAGVHARLNKTEAGLASSQSQIFNLGRAMTQTKYDVRTVKSQMQDTEDKVKGAQEDILTIKKELYSNTVMKHLEAFNVHMNQVMEDMHRAKQDVKNNQRGIYSNMAAIDSVRDSMKNTTSMVVQLQSGYQVLKNGTWPVGKYCIHMKYKKCPPGLRSQWGGIYWECCHDQK